MSGWVLHVGLDYWGAWIDVPPQRYCDVEVEPGADSVYVRIDGGEGWHSASVPWDVLWWWYALHAYALCEGMRALSARRGVCEVRR